MLFLAKLLSPPDLSPKTGDPPLLPPGGGKNAAGGSIGRGLGRGVGCCSSGSADSTNIIVTGTRKIAVASPGK